MSFASGGIVTIRSWVRPFSSCWLTSRRAWVTNGIEASIVGPDDFVAGSAVRANERSAGSAPFSRASAGVPARSVLSSAGMACSSG